MWSCRNEWRATPKHVGHSMVSSWLPRFKARLPSLGVGGLYWSSTGFPGQLPFFRRMRFSKNPLFRVGPFYGCFLFVHGKRYFSVSRHPMISWNNQKFRIQFVFFVVAGDEKFCHVFSLIGDFSCRNLSLWNSSPSDETPVCWLKSLKGEGWKGHQTVVFSAGCRIQVVRGQTLVASVFTKYITYLVWNFFWGSHRL